MSKLFATLGSTRSGKSSFAKEWDGAVLETDHIRLATHGDRYHHETEGLVFAIKYITLKALLMANEKVLAVGTNTSETSIRRLLEIDPDCEFKIFTTSYEILVKRAIETKQDDLIEKGVIDRHCKNMALLANMSYPRDWSPSWYTKDFVYNIQQQINKFRSDYNVTN